jgi:hypothetical protein
VCSVSSHPSSHTWSSMSVFEPDTIPLSLCVTFEHMFTHTHTHTHTHTQIKTPNKTMGTVILSPEGVWERNNTAEAEVSPTPVLTHSSPAFPPAPQCTRPPLAMRHLFPHASPYSLPSTRAFIFFNLPCERQPLLFCPYTGPRAHLTWERRGFVTRIFLL